MSWGRRIWPPNTRNSHQSSKDGWFCWLVVGVAGKRMWKSCKKRKCLQGAKYMPWHQNSPLFFPPLMLLFQFCREQTDSDHPGPTKLFRLAMKIFTVSFPDCLDNGHKYAFFFTPVCHKPKSQSQAIWKNFHFSNISALANLCNTRGFLKYKNKIFPIFLFSPLSVCILEVFSKLGLPQLLSTWLSVTGKDVAGGTQH